MTSNPLPAAVDLLPEATVAGSFSRLGCEARRRLDDWVTSGGMYSQGLDVDHLEMDEDRYKGATQYARAKRAQVELLGLWAERLAPTAVAHATHPGWADTPGVEASLPTFRKITGPALRTPNQGADTLVWLLWADEPAQTSGKLWLDAARARPCTSPAPPRPTRNASASGLGSRTEPGAESGRAVPARI